MPANECSTLALIVQTMPYENRVARVNIDLALAAAAMDFELHVYFIGAAIMQLALQRVSTGAMLPPGYRAWGALPELATTVIYGEQSWLDFCQQKNVELVMPTRGLSRPAMKNAWRQHQHAMVI
jgi:sulfur relay (sulfurtransferase) DsrF/TusC family protein